MCNACSLIPSRCCPLPSTLPSTRGFRQPLVWSASGSTASASARLKIPPLSPAVVYHLLDPR